ncbi:MAG: PPC domain-containing protein, partial [Anaerolineae bacterium]|nr:PPC domain-containing protein [Anaerolineae bacterium]
MRHQALRMWVAIAGITALLLAGLPALAQGNLEFDTEIGGTLAEGAEAAYTFSSDGSEAFSATMTASDGDLDPVLELYDPAGALLAFNDDAAIGQPDAALADVFLAREGVYTLIARSYGNTGSGSYTLVATRETLGEGTAGGGEISLGETVSSAIFTVGQIDYWTFDGTAGQVVSIALNHTDTSSLDPLVELQGPDGDILTYSDDDGGNLNSLINAFTLPVDGTYTIIARSWSNTTTGEYTLTLSEGEALAANTTGTIALDDIVTGNLALGLWDEWSFSGQAGDVISIAILSDDFDTTLTLQDESGNELAFDDDGGPDLNSMINGFTLPADGTYTIVVRSYANRGSGTYSLALASGETPVEIVPQVTPGPTPVVPPTAMPPAGGGVIEPGQTINGTHMAGVEDRWTFTAQAGDVFSIALYGSFDTTMTIYHPDGSESDYNDDGGPGLNSMFTGWMATESGTYTIGVGSFGNDDSGTYSLTLAYGDVYLFPDTWQQGELTLGEPVEGTFATEVLTHVWTFTVEAGQHLELALDGDAYTDVLDAEGNYAGYFGDGAPVYFDNGGEYYLFVYGYYADASYTATLSEAEPPEVNTGNIEVGQTISATLDYGATDEWTIVLSEGDVISVATFTEAFDTYLYIFDAEGEELARNDDGGPGLNS